MPEFLWGRLQNQGIPLGLSKTRIYEVACITSLSGVGPTPTEGVANARPNCD